MINNNLKTILQLLNLYFKSSFIIALVGIFIAFYLGGFYGAYIVTLLAILEISLSFDNAVVNAKILLNMEPKWQDRFIIFGVPFAVFGMRFIFPVLIVSIASGVNVVDTFNIAINNPTKYHHILQSVENLIYSFGGSFLMMVFLDFLFDDAKEYRWIKIIESSKTVKTLSQVNNIELIISISIGLFIISLTKDYSIALAYFGGILLHSIISSIDNLFSVDGIRNGMMGLIYLEVLDASFSFDGVIGAFALSSDIFLIMIGLGIGAMFVRSLTIYFVKNKTLTKFKYLEHGANWAIMALSFIMLCKIFIEINELIVGTIGITFIGLSLWYSINESKD